MCGGEQSSGHVRICVGDHDAVTVMSCRENTPLPTASHRIDEPDHDTHASEREWSSTSSSSRGRGCNFSCAAFSVESRDWKCGLAVVRGAVTDRDVPMAPCTFPRGKLHHFIGDHSAEYSGIITVTVAKASFRG